MRAAHPILLAHGATLAILTLALAAGCSRAAYRAKADRDSYGILAERETSPRWDIPDRSVAPAPTSRLRDNTNPDFGPLPPDDPAAHAYMQHPYKLAGWKGWDVRGVTPTIEQPDWLACLPRDADGAVVLSRDSSLTLALLHSREYQTEVERVYLQALTLSFERFQFDVQAFAGNTTRYDHRGNSSLPGESNLLTTSNDALVTRNLAAGGQLLADFANQFVWEFTGKNVSMASSGLLLAFSQPLMRGAYRQVQLENLTQSERNVLYAVRSFARFRRIFYVDVTADGGFLGLLRQLQQIRNAEFNLAGLERSFEEHQQLAVAGLVATVQVDQVFQNYQQARFSLLQSQLAFQSALDAFKFSLGLPPQLEVTLDRSLLNQFELNDPGLDELRDQAEQLNLTLLQPDDPPAAAELSGHYRTLVDYQTRLGKVIDQIDAEYRRWRDILDRTPKPSPAPGSTADPTGVPGDIGGGRPVRDEAAELERQKQLAERIKASLAELRKDLAEDATTVSTMHSSLTDANRETVWHALQKQVNQDFRSALTDALVIQTQVRVYLIDLSPLTLSQTQAMQLAVNGRLDLMNERALVVDAYRKVEVAGNALKAGLDLNISANLLTDPTKNNPIRFDASENRYAAGFTFDSPLTRRLERNAFRTAQIQYQQVRRRYMAAEDAIRRDVRRQLRALELNRFQFEIARQQLVVAARQVDEAQSTIRLGQANDRSATLYLLSAFQSLLAAKNGIIGGWVAYESSRMDLLRDLDWMEFDERGVWINERDTPGNASLQLGPRAPGPDAEPVVRPAPEAGKTEELPPPT